MSSPFGPPPPGGDQSQAGALYGVSWVFWGVSTALLCARFYTRARIVKALGIDDALIFICWALLTVETGLVAQSTVLGLGRHAYYVPLDELIESIKLQTIAEPIGVLAPAFGRVAVMLLIFKIMGPTTSGSWLLWTVNITMIVTTIANCVTVMVRCEPVSALWDPVGDFTCWPNYVQLDIGYVQGSIAAFTDFLLALFPTTFLWNLQMGIKRKITISAVMGLGVSAGIITSIKLSLYPNLDMNNDFTWSAVTVTILAVMEVNLIIICNSIPVLMPLFRAWQDWRSSIKRSPDGYRSSAKSWIQLRAPGGKTRRSTSNPTFGYEHSQESRATQATETDLRWDMAIPENNV